MTESSGPNSTAGFHSKVDRRSLLKAAAVTIVPRHVLGGAGFVPPSEKLNVACIGVGSQGLRVMLEFLQERDVQIVSVCDVNRFGNNYPEWGRHEFRKKVRRLLGGDGSTWIDWLSTGRPIRLTRSVTAYAGVAGREPCRKIVNAYYGLRRRSGSYRGGTAYVDFRELLEKEHDVDAVIVGTPDHWHAHVSIAAMKKGKHVFCQKPMTRTVYEARRMAEVARETGVATQVALKVQASESTRQLAEWIGAGVIGPVRQVINWSSRPLWPQGIDPPCGALPVPEGLDWDLWLGPSPARPYHEAYLPFVWRGWHDFGTGAVGDMGCYSFDTMFRVLGLEAPERIEASSSEHPEQSFPKACIHYWTFPARKGRPAVEIRWYDGGLRPATPAEMGNAELAGEGLLFVGDAGKILCGFSGSNPRLIPESRMRSFVPPPKTLPRSPGNHREWIDAAKGAAAPCGANFVFEAKVTEAILLANVALRTGHRLRWDREGLRVPDVPEAAALIHPEYRAGWEL